MVSIDDAVMTLISNYVRENNLVEGTISSNQHFNDFDLLLDLIESKSFITNTEKNDIKKFHRFRNEPYKHPDVLITDAVNKYGTLFKVVLAYLYNFRATKSEWEQMVEEYKKKFYK